MMLKTSSRKINPFGRMLKFSLIKNIGIIIVLCIGVLVYCPGSILVNLEPTDYYKSYMLDNVASFITVFAALTAVLFNALNFNFLYKKSSSDVFHAFPLTRNELLISRLLSGIISTFIPTLLCYLSFGILIFSNSQFGSLVQLLYYLLHTLIIVLVCSTFSLIFVICAGSMFDLGVSLIGANLAILAVGTMFENILSNTLAGYTSYGISDILYNISPPYLCGASLISAKDVLSNGITDQSIEFFIRSVIYIIAFTAVSLMLYNKRKAEKSGVAYAYRFMYIVCSILAGICGGGLLGFLFGYNLKSVTFFVFMIIGALLTALIYGVVTNRGFKKFGHSLIMGGISALIIATVFTIGVTGGFGFSSRIPEAEDVDIVIVDAFDESISFENSEKAIDLHKQLIEASDVKEVTQDTYNSHKRNIRLTYSLKNGKTLTREYYVETSLAEDELLAIYKSDERLVSIKEQLDLENSIDLYLDFYVAEDNSYYSAYITRSEAYAFLDAYWQDVQNCDKGVLTDYNHNSFGIGSCKGSKDNYYYFTLECHDKGFENSKQFISEHNLIQRAE